MNQEKQDSIKRWFDRVYDTRGYSYLRPQSAYEIFATILSIRKKQKHLDVACGLGLLIKEFTKQGAEVSGIDLSEVAVQKSKLLCPNAHIQQGNAENLPFEDESFDSITCIGSLERMIDRHKVLNEQLRVLKRDGQVCLMVRNSQNFTWKYIWRPLGLINKKGHQDAMNFRQWVELFENSGLQITHVYPDHWPYYRLQKILMPWRKWSHMKTGQLRKFPFSIHLAYEYIFLMKKA